MEIIKLVFLLAVALTLATAQRKRKLKVGDGCKMRNLQKGTCRLLNKCPSALEDVAKLDVWPLVCSYDDDDNTIVCCDESRPTTSTTTSTTTRRPTSRPDPRPGTTSRPRPVRPSQSRVPGMVSRAKCDEYSRWVRRPTLSLYDDGESENDKIAGQCGVDSATFIIGGVKADRMEFPHMAHLGFTHVETDLPEWSCGGSLISERYVLTAAHCLRKGDGSSVTHVRLGVDDVRSDITVRVAQAIPHPEYKRSQHYNDIALLRLSQSIEFTDFRRPACLEVNRDLPYKSSTASGWGVTESGKQSDQLLKTLLPFVPFAQCSETYKVHPISMPRGIDDATMVCAGGYKINNDTCQGDSGGPLQVVLSSPNCMYSIVGVTSFGIKCGIAPGVYSRVSAFLSWLEPIVWPESSKR